MRSLLRRPVLTLAVLAASAGLEVPRDAVAALTRSSAGAGGIMLLLGGAPAGNVRASAGGAAVGDVTSEAAGAGAPNKHISSVHYEPIELEVDLSLERSFYDWVNAAWRGAPQPRSGTLQLLDLNRNIKQSRDFQNALITETTLSACDASSKAPGTLTLALAPERVTSSPASAKAAAPSVGRSKPWVASNFRLEIDGLDTARVRRVSPVHVKMALGPSLGARDRAPQVAKLEIDNLKIQLSESGAESWRQWHDDFVVKGNASDKSERSGRLVLLGPNLKDELAEVRLHNLGIVALRSLDEGGVGQVEAELYVERLELSLEPAGK
jgi:hypothetical protein